MNTFNQLKLYSLLSLLLLLLSSNRLLAQEEELIGKIASLTCDCISQIDSSFNDEPYLTASAFCVFQSYQAHKREFYEASGTDTSFAFPFNSDLAKSVFKQLKEKCDSNTLKRLLQILGQNEKPKNVKSISDTNSYWKPGQLVEGSVIENPDPFITGDILQIGTDEFTFIDVERVEYQGDDEEITKTYRIYWMDSIKTDLPADFNIQNLVGMKFVFFRIKESKRFNDATGRYEPMYILREIKRL